MKRGDLYHRRQSKKGDEDETQEAGVYACVRARLLQVGRWSQGGSSPPPPLCKIDHQMIAAFTLPTKRDYGQVTPLPNARIVLGCLGGWIENYNDPARTQG
jgi:hypothetical protein